MQMRLVRVENRHCIEKKLIEIQTSSRLESVVHTMRLSEGLTYSGRDLGLAAAAVAAAAAAAAKIY